MKPFNLEITDEAMLQWVYAAMYMSVGSEGGKYIAYNFPGGRTVAIELIARTGVRKRLLDKLEAHLKSERIYGINQSKLTTLCDYSIKVEKGRIIVGCGRKWNPYFINLAIEFPGEIYSVGNTDIWRDGNKVWCRRLASGGVYHAGDYSYSVKKMRELTRQAIETDESVYNLEMR